MKRTIVLVIALLSLTGCFFGIGEEAESDGGEGIAAMALLGNPAAPTVSQTGEIDYFEIPTGAVYCNVAWAGSYEGCWRFYETTVSTPSGIPGPAECATYGANVWEKAKTGFQNIHMTYNCGSGPVEATSFQNVKFYHDKITWEIGGLVSGNWTVFEFYRQ